MAILIVFVALVGQLGLFLLASSIDRASFVDSGAKQRRQGLAPYATILVESLWLLAGHGSYSEIVVLDS